MKSIKEAVRVIDRAAKSIQSWDIRDQLMYQVALVDFAELCDLIMSKYDGREERLNDLVEMLKEGKDD